MFLFAKSLLARGKVPAAIVSGCLVAHVAAGAALSVNAKTGFSSQPLHFEANQGQWTGSDSALYLARTREALFALSATETSVTLSKTGRPQHPGDSVQERLRLRTFETRTLHMRLLEANRNAQVVGMNPLEGKVNYFLGNNPA